MTNHPKNDCKLYFSNCKFRWGIHGPIVGTSQLGLATRTAPNWSRRYSLPVPGHSPAATSWTGIFSPAFVESIRNLGPRCTSWWNAQAKKDGFNHLFQLVFSGSGTHYEPLWLTAIPTTIILLTIINHILPKFCTIILLTFITINPINTHLASPISGAPGGRETRASSYSARAARPCVKSHRTVATKQKTSVPRCGAGVGHPGCQP